MAFSVLRLRFRFLGFPRSACLVSRAFLPGSGTQLSVCFLSSFPVSLPQLFHRCFPSFPLSFVRFSSGLSACFPVSFVPFSPLLTTQPSALSFPFFPFSPGSGSFGALRFLSSPSFSSSVRPVSMPFFRFRYSASCVSFLRSSVSCHRHYAAPGLLFPARPFPFAFALGSGYLALDCILRYCPVRFVPAANFYRIAHSF